MSSHSTAAQLGPRPYRRIFTMLLTLALAAGGLSAVAPPAGAATVGAFLSITEDKGIGGSSGGKDSFQLENTSTTAKITSIRMNVESALLPDIVFDPDGTAGDEAGIDFQINTDPGVGFVARTFSQPWNGVDGDDGWLDLLVTFNDFDPGETLGYRVDTDPNSIKGTPKPGPNGTGHISGFELSGSVVTVTFSNGATRVNELFPADGNQGGSRVTVDAARAAAPTIEMLGVGNDPAIVDDTAQTIRVSGPAGADVRLIRAESALFIDPPGYDIDPFETNKVVNIDHESATIGGQGHVDIPVTLTQQEAEGINLFMATVMSADGEAGRVSNQLTVQYDDRPVLLPTGFGDPEGNTGSKVFNVPISLSTPAAAPVTVEYEAWPCTAFGNCGPGFAEAGTDYQPVASGVLTFQPGQTSKSVPVTVFGDTTPEPRLLWGEWFFVRFSNASSNARLDDSFFGLGVGIIGEDD